MEILAKVAFGSYKVRIVCDALPFDELAGREVKALYRSLLSSILLDINTRYNVESSFRSSKFRSAADRVKLIKLSGDGSGEG